MSGHSHFKSIKYRKEITDKKRGQIFSKLSKQISVAVKERGKDPEMNPKLRLAIGMARSFHMPKENIERAIKRGTGEIEGGKLESFLFEAYGPGGIALLIEGITDNKNRALSEIKQVLFGNGGKLVETGAVKWLFERKGVITLRPAAEQSSLRGSPERELRSTSGRITNREREDLELKAIGAGAEDIKIRDETLEIYTKIEDLEKVKQTLKNQGVQVESSSLEWVAKENIQVEKNNKGAAQKLFDALEDLDSVQEIYSNLAS